MPGGIGKVMRIPCSTAVLRAASLAPGRKADTRGQPISTARARSRVVVCDFSNQNPNVFYEAGIAHTLGRPVIAITQHEGDVPFDLRHRRFVKYLNNEEGLADLSRKLSRRLRTILSQ